MWLLLLSSVFPLVAYQSFILLWSSNIRYIGMHLLFIKYRKICCFNFGSIMTSSAVNIFGGSRRSDHFIQRLEGEEELKRSMQSDVLSRTDLLGLFIHCIIFFCLYLCFHLSLAYTFGIEFPSHVVILCLTFWGTKLLNYFHSGRIILHSYQEWMYKDSNVPTCLSVMFTTVLAMWSHIMASWLMQWCLLLIGH